MSREEYEKLKGCENTIKRFSKISPTEAESENKSLKEEIAVILAQKRNIWEKYNQLKEELAKDNAHSRREWYQIGYKEARKETAREILKRLYCYGDRDEALRRHLLDIADDYGVDYEKN